MKLVDLLATDRIVLGVHATTVREAAGPLVHAVIESGVATDPDSLEALLSESLPGEAVTVGQRAFLLHFRSAAVEAMTVVVGVTAEPVHREHAPGKEARIVLLILAPPRTGPTFLAVLGTFARVLGREEIVSALVAAETPEQVLTIEALADVVISDELLIRDVLTPWVISTGPETTVSEAAALMARHHLAALPVVSEEKEVLGMVSYGELLRHLLPGYAKRKSGELGARPSAADRVDRDRREMPVREAMDRSVLCIADDHLLTEIATLMVNKNVDRLPVVRDGALVGLLTREDIVRRLFGP